MEVEISIELLVIVGIALLFFIWLIWYSLTKWIAKLRYKPKNDKSKYGEEKRRGLIEGGEHITPTPTKSIPGFTESAERRLLPPSDAGSTGKDSQRFRGIFKRRK